MQKKNNNKCLIRTAAILCMAGLLLSGCEKKREIFVTEEAEAETGAGFLSDDLPEETLPAIYVHVCGAVSAEGVYALDAGSRVFDAVEAAGGLTPDADGSAVNQAAPLTDGQRLYIPTVEETTEAGGVSDGTGLTGDTRININTATEAELCTLSGIGPSRAADIIRYREEHGGFSGIEDIMNVTGIKEKTFEKIRDQIRTS